MKKLIIIVILAIFSFACPSKKPPSEEVLYEEEPKGFIGLTWKQRENIFSRQECKLDTTLSYKIDGLVSYICEKEQKYENFLGTRTKYLFYQKQYFMGVLFFDYIENIDQLTLMLFQKFGPPNKTTETIEIFTGKKIEKRIEWQKGNVVVFLDYYEQNKNGKLTMAYKPITSRVDWLLNQKNNDED